MSDGIQLQSIKVGISETIQAKDEDQQTTDSNYGSMEEVPVVEKYEIKDNGNALRQRQTQNSNKPDLPEKLDESEFEDDEDFEPDNKCSKFINGIQVALRRFYKNQTNALWTIFWITLASLYFAYFGYAMYFRFGDEGSYRLLVCTIIGVLGIVFSFVGRILSDTASFSNKCMETKQGDKILRWVHYFLQFAVFIFAVVYIVLDVAMETPENLISISGLVVFVLLFYIFSYNPARVKWRPVFWGLAIQFIFAVLILRWSTGYQIFQWLGDRVTEFLAYAQAGAKFVFGDKYVDHYFAFGVLTTVVFFSTMTTILYYFGIMQFIIQYVARFIAMALGTSATESINAAANIFMGQTEAPLTIRPFLPDMTKSELHAVCTGGFATVAGTVLAAYILFGVPANHLLSASVMSAPAALAMAKLSYPETKKSKIGTEVYNMPKGQERNVIEAASTGATQSIKLVANIAVNLIAFISILEFVNATLKWFGHRVGLEKPHHEELTFQMICSYVFWPLAYVMGIVPSDCRRIGELIGVKTFINEMVAYRELGVYVQNKKNLTWYEGLVNTTNEIGSEITYTGNWTYNDYGDIVYSDLNITLAGGILQERSVVIATYALCGFSNISSIGIMLGGLGAMAPSRKSDLSTIVVRAMIAGNVACFMTACVAGLLYKGEL